MRNKKIKPVVIFNQKGVLMAQYQSAYDVAREYGCSKDTVEDYINNGKLYKKGNCFFDYALEKTTPERLS